MSFDATARQRVAPGAEKQEMPACLPMVSSMGDERAIMKIETSTGMTAAFSQESAHGLPCVLLDSIPGLPGRHIYNAAQFLDAEAKGNQFTVLPDWNDQSPFQIPKEDLRRICKMIRQSADRKLGYFEMRWVALDPSLPF